MENWDLEAVVRGCNNNFEALTNTMEYSQPCNFGFAPLTIEEDDDIFHAFPQLFEATTAFDELEELYKPFYPLLQPISPPTIPTPSVSVPQEVAEKEEEPKKLKSMKESSPMCKRRLVIIQT